MNEKVLLVTLGAVVGGVVAAVTIYALGPAPPVAGAPPAASGPGLIRKADPGVLPPLQASEPLVGTASAVAGSAPPPSLAPVDAVLQGDLKFRGAGDPRYEEYRKALEQAAPMLRALSPELQSDEIVRIKDRIFGARK